MKEKILAYLKGKLKQGISKSYLDAVAERYSKSIKEETEIEGILTQDTVDLIQFNADELQREGDRRATDAQDTALTNFKTKYGLDNEGKPVIVKDPNKSTDPTDISAIIAKAVSEAIKPLQEKVEGIDKAKLQETLTQSVKSHEKLKGIPASYLKGRNLTVESEGEIESLVLGISEDYTAFKQELTEQGIQIDIPLSSEQDSKEGEEAGKLIAEKRNNDTSKDGGKEI